MGEWISQSYLDNIMGIEMVILRKHLRVEWKVNGMSENSKEYIKIKDYKQGFCTYAHYFPQLTIVDVLIFSVLAMLAILCP